MGNIFKGRAGHGGGGFVILGQFASDAAADAAFPNATADSLYYNTSTNKLRIKLNNGNWADVDAVPGTMGNPGVKGDSVFIQFSEDNATWHDIAVSDDLYIRFAEGTAQPADSSTDWSIGYKIVADNGLPGLPGTPGGGAIVEVGTYTGATVANTFTDMGFDWPTTSTMIMLSLSNGAFIPYLVSQILALDASTTSSTRDSDNALRIEEGTPGTSGQLYIGRSATNGAFALTTSAKTSVTISIYQMIPGPTDPNKLSSVSSDATLTGEGTATDPLGVASEYTASEKSKLAGIASGAEVNVNADWDSTSGDDQVLNKPLDSRFVPLGGTDTQILAKASGVDGDTEWVNPPVSPDDQTATEVPTNTSNFGNNIPATADTVQKALDVIDNLSIGTGGGGGGGIASVTSDATLTGDGTATDPLGVASEFTTAEKTKLGTLESDAQLPVGGTAGQIVEKIDGTNYNVRWVDAPTGGGGGGGLTSPFHLTLHLDGTGTATDPLGIADDGVGTDQIATHAVTPNEIAADAVTTAKILDDNVTNAKIANDAVHHAQMANNSVDTSELINLAVETAKIDDDAVTEDKIVDNLIIPIGGTVGQVLSKVDSTDRNVQWVTPSTGGGGGGLTSVSSDATLDGTGIATDPLGIADGGVDTDQLAFHAVTNVKLANDAVLHRNMAANSVGTPEIQSDAVTEAKVADDAITEDKVADNSIATAKIHNNAITHTKMADDSVGTNEIIDDSIENAHLADNSVHHAQMADNSVDTTELINLAVTAAKIADETIIESKLADRAVAGGKIALGTIESEHISDAAIGTDQLDDGAVTRPKIPGELIVPVGGTINQVLGKRSAADGDTEWQDQTGSGGGGADGDSVFLQFSEDGTTGSWHDVKTATDTWIRSVTAQTKPADTSADWSVGTEFVGDDGVGTVGPVGPRGAGDATRVVTELYRDATNVTGANTFRAVDLLRAPAPGSQLEVKIIGSATSVTVIIPLIETDAWLINPAQSGTSSTVNTFAFKAHRLAGTNTSASFPHTTWYVGRRTDTSLVLACPHFSNLSHTVVVTEIAESATVTSKKAYYGFMDGLIAATVDVSTLTEVDLGTAVGDRISIHLTTPASGATNHFVLLFATDPGITQIQILGANGIDEFTETADVRVLNTENYTSRTRGPMPNSQTINYEVIT